MGNGTSIGKVRGLGAAHHGPHHWLVQRFTAIGNVVLMSWLLVSLIMPPTPDREEVLSLLVELLADRAQHRHRRQRRHQL